MNETNKKIDWKKILKKIGIIAITVIILSTALFFTGFVTGRSSGNDGTGISTDAQAEIDKLTEQNKQLREQLTGIRIINSQLTKELERLSEFGRLLRDINGRLNSYIRELQSNIDELRILHQRDRELIESLGSDTGSIIDWIDQRLQGIEETSIEN